MYYGVQSGCPSTYLYISKCCSSHDDAKSDSPAVLNLWVADSSLVSSFLLYCLLLYYCFGFVHLRRSPDCKTPSHSLHRPVTKTGNGVEHELFAGVPRICVNDLLLNDDSISFVCKLYFRVAITIINSALEDYTRQMKHTLFLYLVTHRRLPMTLWSIEYRNARHLFIDDGQHRRHDQEKSDLFNFHLRWVLNKHNSLLCCWWWWWWWWCKHRRSSLA